MSTSQHPTISASPAQLRLVSPGAEPQTVALDPGRNTIGRAADNHVTVEAPTVSDLHCEVEITPTAAIVRDLGSTNGTFVNGEPVQEGVIQSGETLRVGDVELLFERPDVEMPALSPLESSPGNCEHHPNSAARWSCSECGQRLCGACVQAVKLDPGRTVMICPACKGLCEPVEHGSGEQSSESFATGLVQALLYPFRGTALMLLVLALVTDVLLAFVGRSLMFVPIFMIFGVGAGAYVLSFLREVLLSSSLGERQPPRWPDGQGQALAETVIQFLALYVVTVGPWTVYRVWLRSGADAAPWVGMILLAWAVLYTPMAALAVVIYDDVSALNPLLVFVSIVRTFARYSAVCALCALLLSAICLLNRALDFGPAWRTFASGFPALYGGLVMMRALGWFYFCTKEQLSWR